MRNIIITLTVGLTLIISGCMSMPIFSTGSSPETFEMLTDTSTSGSKYAKTKKFAGVMTEEMFDYFMQIGRTSIVEDKELKKSGKKKLLKELDNLHFKENQFLYFTMVYNMPFLDSELKFKFEVSNGKNQKYILGYTPIYQKLYKYGALVSVNYSFIVYGNKSIEKIIKSGLANFKVNFPDGKSSTFKIKL